MGTPIAAKPLHRAPVVGDKFLATRFADGVTVNIPLENLGHPAQMVAARGEYNALAYAQGVAINDGASRPLSGLFGTLAAAQAVYPHARSLTDELAWCAIQAAINAAKGAPNGAGQYTARGRVLLPGGTYRVNRSVDIRSVYGLEVAGGQGPDAAVLQAAGIPAHTIGVTTTGGAILRVEGLYQGRVARLRLVGDGACHGIKYDGLPAITPAPGPAITLAAGAGTPTGFVGGQTYYVRLTVVTGSNGESVASTNVGSYTQPGTPTPIQVNVSFAQTAYGGGVRYRVYVGETSVASAMRYVGETALYGTATTNVLTITDPTGIAHPVSGLVGAAPPSVALTGSLVSTANIFEHVSCEGPFGAGHHALWIGSDRFQADQTEYIRCKFDGGATTGSDNLVHIEDANAVIHNFYGCIFYRSGARGITSNTGTGGSFNLFGCGFTANTDYDIETYPGSRGYHFAGCWTESSTRFLNVGAGGTNQTSVTLADCSVNTCSDPQHMLQVSGAATLNIIGGRYNARQATPGRIATGVGTAMRADINIVGAIFEGNPFGDSTITAVANTAIHLTGMRLRSTALSTEAETLDGYVPRGSSAAPLAYGTSLGWAPAAWLKIPSGTVLAAGANTFTGNSNNCKGYTGITVDSVHGLGGLAQPYNLVAKDAGSGAFQITLVVGASFTLTSDLVFRVTFRPDPVTL